MREQKTNVMRVFDAHKIKYDCFSYPADPTMTGVDVANALGLEVASVFKTLVTSGKSGKICVFMIPVAAELDLKKAALVAKEKSVAMVKSKELLDLTGYVHGGCSPVGMKKQYVTFIDASATNHALLTFSAGRVGAQVRASLADLMKVVRLSICELVK